MRHMDISVRSFPKNMPDDIISGGSTLVQVLSCWIEPLTRFPFGCSTFIFV